MKNNRIPHNAEAERAILGAVFLDNSLFDSVVEQLGRDDFYLGSHRVIFDAYVALAESKRPIDPVMLEGELREQGTLETIGGMACVASLMDGALRIVNLDFYIKILHREAEKRKLIHAGRAIAAMAFDDERDEEGRPIDLAAKAEGIVASISDNGKQSGYEPIGNIARGCLEDLERIAANPKAVNGIPTGFGELDRLTNGLQPSDLIIVAARPSMGKTSFALAVAHHAAILGKKVLFLSLEMSKKALGQRILTSYAHIDAHRMRGGFVNREEWSRLANGLQELSECPIFIDDTANISILEARAKARRLKAEQGIDLLVVDYMQLMRGRGRVESRQQEVAQISRDLKGLAKELDIPVVALSQLSRAPEQRQNHRPILSDLRESGGVEQDADLVMFIYREEVYFPTEENCGVAEIIIGKQRNGPTDTVRLAFIKQFSRFENMWQDR